MITGAGGQLGSEWVRQLTMMDIDFQACDSKSLDITDAAAVNEAISSIKPDYLINTAAYTKVDQAEEEPDIADAVNFHAVRNLGESCRKHNVKLVHYSTDYVFPGAAEDRAKFPDGYPENADTQTVNRYGSSKLKGEEALRETGCDHIINRVSWLCGADGHNFMKTMLRLAKERDELKVVADQFGSPTFAFDVVKANLRLLEIGFSGTIHTTTEGLHTWHGFASAIISAAGLKTIATPITSDQFPMKAPRPAFSKLSTKSFFELTGLKFEMDTGIRKILDILN